MTDAAGAKSGEAGEAARWLDARERPAPVSVRTVVDGLVAGTDPAQPLHERFAAAAIDALETVIRGPSDRTSASTLLAADALLTYACEAAAETGLDRLEALAVSLDFDRFSELRADA